MSLKQLQTEWYKKLKDSGFKDIEQDDEKLKTWDSFYFEARHSPVAFEISSEYYYQAEHFLNSYKFKCPIEREIWALHSEGIPLREIARRVSTRIDVVMYYRDIYNKDKINKIILSLREVMRECSKSEM